ncbi:hypothetical protein ONE63_004687 [Megalurothrips usitatus]|uniref:Malonate--CoA ligase ACSF3, mitochondrial-like n=1 Tax=Megalurothrips usitatus TaxID=439358 RepID=A0AAV7X2Z9_9NEOP|nr:hypothetical protein ONE63_004687 [Megalurothrips usitatus]
MVLLGRPLVLVPKSLRYISPLTCRLHIYAPCAASTGVKTKTTSPKPSVTPIFRNAPIYGEKTALRDRHGDYTYMGLFLSSRQLAHQISELLKGKEQERVAFLCPNDASYVITQWACWMSGQIVVPLSPLHPEASLQYFVNDSDASLLLTTNELAPQLAGIAQSSGRKLLVIDDALRRLALKPDVKIDPSQVDFIEPAGPVTDVAAGLEDEFYADSDAMIIYTSGTTSTPKGVLLSYQNLDAQVQSLVEAWNITGKDNVLHTLPLHHIHGIVNGMMCPLTVGGRCTMLPSFSSSKVWAQLLAIRMKAADRVNVFMGVPTSYIKLIEEYELIFSKNEKMREYIQKILSEKIRLMTSGSAPLPSSVFEAWDKISGHRLLERFGMSEVGMVLSNPLNPTSDRRPGFVGTPLPSTKVKIVRTEKGQENPNEVKEEVLCEGDENGTKVLVNDGEPTVGQLYVKGPNVFQGYWRKPETTAKEFAADRWFKTGDTAQFVDGSYKILGRTSVDILKTGGYKVSAVEVEAALLGHPDIIDCSVVGLPDATWGQKVAAVVVTQPGAEILLSQVREWSRDKLPPYAIPTVLRVLDKIPRNSLGKVNKVNMVKEVFQVSDHKST